MSTGTAPRHIGKYVLQERLGRGGMAEVWMALDTQLHRHVAIKLLHADLQNDPDFINRFLREARVVASLHHPNIVQIYDFQISRPPESDSTFAYMVMDYVEGQTLADYIRSTSHKGKFPSPEEIVHLFTSISLGVDYAHQHGMIHRDLKPANILLDKRNTSHNPIGEPILTDFGLVKLLGTTTGSLSGSWLGTPLYIAPEQAQGYPGNERSDIYALGVILYELCTGVLPFRGETSADIMRQHIITMPASPVLINSNIPPALTMVIMRCLAKDPAARFTSAASLSTALAEALNVPVPESLGQPAYPPDAANEPTYYKPAQPNLTPILTQDSSPLSPIGGQSPGQRQGESLQVALSTPAFAASSNTGQNTPMTPSGISRTGASFATRTPQNSTLLPGAPAPAPRHRRRGLLIVLVALLVIVLLGSGLGTLFLLSHRAPTLLANQIIGHAYFVSSGQFNEGTTQGINDQLQIILHNVPDSAAGKSYYAWLLGDGKCNPLSNSPSAKCDPKDPRHERILSPVAPIFLGKLVSNNGTVLFHYQGDQKHSDLIGTHSRLLVTEENANSLPNFPSADKSTWRYYAEIPQARPTLGLQHQSALDYLRGLLYEGPNLVKLGIHGGLNTQFLRNTQKVLEWVTSARDSWSANATPSDIAFIQRQITRTLYYLDGSASAHLDIPSTAPMLANPPLIQIPLLSTEQVGPPKPKVGGYLDRINDNLDNLPATPGITREMSMLANQANSAILHDQILPDTVQFWLENVHQDAKAFMHLKDTQLLQPSTLSLLNDMAAQANYAFVGRLDPNTNQVREGVVQIYYDIQRLATFDIRPYISPSSTT